MQDLSGWNNKTREVRINIIVSKYLHQKASMITCLGYLIERREMEDIHKLRITIRRNKALHSFLAFSFPNEFNKKQFFNLYSSLFNQAGQVREAQINLAQLSQHHAKYLLPFISDQSKRLASAWAQLLVTIRSLDQENMEQEERAFLKRTEPLTKEFCYKNRSVL